MYSLFFWSIGWIGFVLMAADAFKPAKKPRKGKTGLHHWIAGRTPIARTHSVRSNNIGHWCYSPAA